MNRKNEKKTPQLQIVPVKLSKMRQISGYFLLWTLSQLLPGMEVCSRENLSLIGRHRQMASKMKTGLDFSKEAQWEINRKQFTQFSYISI